MEMPSRLGCALAGLCTMEVNKGCGKLCLGIG